MKFINSNVNQKSKPYSCLVVTALITTSLFQFIAPVFAEGTTAGQSISNTATATYEDPNSPNTIINTTSNTVVVSVAEVAGITVTASGTTDATPATPISRGDVVYFNYTVTNVGNDSTKFRIPNTATVTGPGTAGNLEYSTDGGNTWTAINGTEFITNSIPADGSILVRVPVTVSSTVQTNEDINVVIGNTPGNNQNQPRTDENNDIFTVDNPDTGVTGEVVGIPTNGVREASATQKITVNQLIKNYALATILKVRSGYDNANTADITDDKLSYDLSLRVELNDPTGNGITPAPLAGTTVKGLTGARILVSDAIPLSTELVSVPNPPSGWQVVYTTDPVSTNANAANWSLLTPGVNLSTVIRIGFVNDPNVITTVAPGTTVNGFNFEVKVKSGTTAPLTINNMAQLFGQTSGIPVVDNNNDGIPDNQIYDESGDQNPSNYDGGTIPPGSTDTNNDGVPDAPGTVTDGFIDTPTELNNNGSDTNNDNSGQGSGGEVNTFTINVPPIIGVLNGPEDNPNATVSTGNNDDFTNKSSVVPPDTAPGSTFDPNVTQFINTIQNNGNGLSNISLLPTPPGNPADLPTNTTVTITYQGESKTYTWNGSQFTIGGNPVDEKTDYITIADVPAGAKVNYGVKIDLPPGTPLSTDTEKGFPVPITAFVDDATPGLGTETAKNTTIDRVYTGFLKLLKESRILPGTGTPVQGNDGNFSTDAKKPSPGNIIEYRITYKNISEATSGTGNVILRADKVVITEDGTLSTSPNDGKNNWALDNDNNGRMDTSNVVGSARDSGTSTIQYFSGQPSTNSTADQAGTTANTDVTKYVNTVTNQVQPGESREFTFQRKVN